MRRWAVLLLLPLLAAQVPERTPEEKQLKRIEQLQRAQRAAAGDLLSQSTADGLYQPLATSLTRLAANCTIENDSTPIPDSCVGNGTDDTGAGSPAWGSITGTLSDQADLQAALDAKLASSSYTAADVLSKLLTVDGSGSGVDADLLDGSSSAAFAAASHTHAESDVTNLVSDLAAKQASDADLTSWAAITRASGFDTFATTPSAANLATLVTGESYGLTDAELAALAGLTSAVDALPYFTGSGTAAVTTLTSAARTVLDDTSTANMLTTLGAAPIASPTFTGTVNLPGTTVIAAGSASASSWPKLTSGTLLTTAEDGAIEQDADATYITTDAGNRGVVQASQWIRADATRTFTSNTSQQAIFNSPTNGRITLETGTYEFEALIAMTSMSGTSGNGKFSVIGAGTATLGSILWQADGRDIAAETTGGAAGTSWHVIATQTAANIVTAATGTALSFYARGTFEVTGAGTIIPSFAQTTAAAAVVSIGSFFRVARIGSTSMTSVGQVD